MKRSSKTFILSLIIAAMLASCAPSTPVIENSGSLSSVEETSQTSSQTSSESSEETSSAFEETSSKSEESSESSSASEVSNESSSSASESSTETSSQTSSASESSSSSAAEQPSNNPNGTYSENGVTLSQTVVNQGEFMKIRVEGIDLSGFWFTDFYGRSRDFFEYNGAWYALIPVEPADEIGEYLLSIDFGSFVFEKTVTVADRKFRTQYLEVTPTTLEETIENERVRAEFNSFVERTLTHWSSTPLWEGKFVYPLGNYQYWESTKFGSFRTFSNGATEWHNATDMAAAGGTPIYATNSGNIIFAGFLGVSGNTVVIDHGAGVLSWHYHLSEITTHEGAFVSKNEVIGKVGTTGLSTGNHLHFGLSVGGKFTDPMKVVGKKIDLEF